MAGFLPEKATEGRLILHESAENRKSTIVLIMSEAKRRTKNKSFDNSRNDCCDGEIADFPVGRGKRSFLGKTAFIGAAAVLAQASVVVEGTENPPNILFINADDLGWGDVGFMGSTYYETPNIDRLAAQGMRFMDAYAPAANCAPSRAVVYTGQYGPRHGIYTVGSSERRRAVWRRLIPTPNTEFITEDHVTFVSLLNEAGYATWHFGKWHLSEDPTRHGFDVNVGGFEGGHPPAGYFSPYDNPKLEDGPEGEHLTFRLTDEAIRHLEDHDPERPFFLSMQFYIPHTPIQAKEEVIERYDHRIPTATHFNPVYAAMVDHMDVNVGRLLDTLDELGMRDNTFVIFTSDNGGIYNISRLWPLRGEKGSYYEGGIRVPMVVRWPGQVASGGVSEEPVSGVDFFPTFIEVAGIEAPEDHLLDGLSLVPLLRDEETLPERPLFWHFPVYLQRYGRGNVETRDPLFRTRPGMVMRYGRWKLHEYFEDGGLELYHLDKDLGERLNLAEILPDKTEEMHAIMKEWREETGAPVPTEPNPRFDPESEAEALERFYRRQ